jgi:hypothetical protein
MLILLTMCALVWLGYEAAVRLFRNRASHFELACAAFTLGSAFWIASVWLAALTHRLDRTTLVARTIVVTVAAVILLAMRLRRSAAIQIGNDALLTWFVPFVPLGAWIGFILWRSTLVPPLSHDALAYHLPRAVLWMREHGFAAIPRAVDARMRILPANYELLLADAMLVGNGDRLTEWIGVFFYVAFVIACGALAQRWWSERPLAALPVTLLSSSVLVLLLHTGADKNDTMTGFFMVAALVWTGRFFTTRDPLALVLCGVSVIAAIGTKPQGLMLAACLFPLVVWRARELRIATLARVLGLSLVAAVLLGGAFYAVREKHTNLVAYDDWPNLWQGPWVLLTAPFSPDPDGLYVPGDPEPWFWKRDEIYFSHLGIPFVLCALLVPFALRRFRDEAPETKRERIAIALAALGTLVLMLPVRDVPMPRGIYVTALPRYTLFLVPVVFALTVAPLFLRFSAKHARIATYVLVLWFCKEAMHAGVHDRFVPIEYVVSLIGQPESRVVMFDPFRAALAADHHAGPRDMIVFDAGYGAWIHPAFGRDLARPVTFLDASSGRFVIPKEAKWVIVDRSFALIWQHPRFRESWQWRRYLSRGTPPPGDTRVIRALLRDRRFQPVLYLPERNQAVFRRVG